MGIFKVNLEHMLKSARVATQKEDWPQAIKCWRKIINKFCETAPPEAWFWLTQSYVNAQKLAEAEKIAARGLTMQKNHTKLLVLAAKVASANANWEVARQHWQKVIISISSKAPSISWANLARAERMLGQLEAAEATAKEGFVKHGQSTEILVELAEIATVKKDWRAALNYWTEVLAAISQQAKPNQLTKQYARLNISILKRLLNITKYKKEIKAYQRSRKKPEIAIVTSMTKGYDGIKPHEVIDNRFDYIVYTNADIEDMGIYDIRPLPKPNLDGARSIRYVKTHPHTLFDGYDLVVWLDTSLMIVDDIYPILDNFMLSGKAIGASIHPNRESVREEFEACFALNKGNYQDLKRQMDYYKEIGFLENGLAECGFLAFNLRDKKESVAAAMDTWWEQICQFSTRDQLSFTYALAQHDVEWYPLTKPPHGIRNHPGFVLTSHKTDYRVLDKLISLLNQNKTSAP